jgi:hypothetical protein
VRLLENDVRVIPLECWHATPVRSLIPSLDVSLTRALKGLDPAFDFFCCALRQPVVWYQVHEKGGDPVTIIPGTREVIVT